jgi:hypothetical protein
VQITILNGEPDLQSPFHAYLLRVATTLAARGNTVTRLDLAAIDLKGCSGCWGCWVKTPGECVKRDSSSEVCQAAIRADLLVLASPMRMGFTTALLKRAMDQMIPLVHPYFTVEGGEIHHRARYARYPLFALLLDPGTDSDAEDIEITQALWARTARNFKSRLVSPLLVNRPAEEVANELALVA